MRRDDPPPKSGALIFAGTVEPTHNDDDLRLALKWLETIFQAEHVTAQAHERDALVTLIEAYESEHCDFGQADPVGGIGLNGRSPPPGLR